MLCCSKGVGPKKNESVYNPVLAKGWQEYWSTEYKLPYYYHKKLKKTQWDHPGYSLPNGKKLLTNIDKGELKEGIRKVVAKPVTCFFKEGPLGLKLREDIDNEGNMFVEVHEISPNEQAGQEGLISEKMRLLSVAGEKCIGWELPEILAIVKRAKRPIEMQFIKPPPKKSTTMKKEAVKPLIKSSLAEKPKKPTLMEKVYSFQEGPIGLSLQDGYDPDGSQFVEVMSKHEGSQAANQSSLHLHDRITRIGQTSVVGLDFAHVMVNLKEARRPVELAFVSPPDEVMEELKFTFSPGPMGIVLGDGISENVGRAPILFVEVLEKVPGSQADGFSNLHIHDRIVRAGDVSVKGLDFAHVMEILQGAARPLELSFVRPNTVAVTESQTAVMKPLTKSSLAEKPKKPTLMEKVYSFQEGPIGLSLQDGYDPDGSQFVEVMSKHEGSQAANQSSLHLHDRITRIGQTSVVGLDFAHVMVNLKEARRPVELAFVSPPDEVMEELKFTFSPGPMGIVLGDGISENVGRAPILFVEVLEKVPGSQADGFSNLHIHDRIVRAGDVSVKGLDFAHVMEILQGAARPLELSFVRPNTVAVTESQTAVVSAQKSPPTRARTSVKKGGKKDGGKKRSLLKTPRTQSSDKIAQESALQKALSTPGEVPETPPVRSPGQVEPDLSTPKRAEPSPASDKPNVKLSSSLLPQKAVSESPSGLKNRDIKSSAPPPPLKGMPDTVGVEKPADAVLEKRDIKSSAPSLLPKAMPDPVGMEKPADVSTPKPTRARGSTKVGGKRGGSKAGGARRSSISAGLKKK